MFAARGLILWMQKTENFNRLSYNKFTVLTRSDGVTNQPKRRMSKTYGRKKENKIPF